MHTGLGLKRRWVACIPTNRQNGKKDTRMGQEGPNKYVTELLLTVLRRAGSPNPGASYEGRGRSSCDGYSMALRSSHGAFSSECRSRGRAVSGSRRAFERRPHEPAKSSYRALSSLQEASHLEKLSSGTSGNGSNLPPKRRQTKETTMLSITFSQPESKQKRTEREGKYPNKSARKQLTGYSQSCRSLFCL